MIERLQAKIHRATITDANINYDGSITISADLIKLANLQPFQKVLVVDINNGQRFETYVISTQKKNEICVNGAAARLVSVGDKVIIMSFEYVAKTDDDYAPIILRMNDNNEVIE